jgi:Tol biopolymer transport system component
MFVLGGAVVTLWKPAAPPGEPIEFVVDRPKNGLLNYSDSFAVSPNGRHLAVVVWSKGVSALSVGSVTKPGWQVVPQTEGGRNPFWSADGESLGFFADGKMKTVNLTTGAVTTVCEASTLDMASGTWSPNGTILFAGIGGLKRVSGPTGVPIAATVLRDGDTVHLSPSFLPDGNHFLYLVQGRGGTELRIGSLTSSDSSSLGVFESNAVFARNHLFFVRGTSLMAQPFDTATLELNGKPQTITNDTAIMRPYQRRGQFSVSSAGVLAYRPTGPVSSQLTWVDRDGKPLPTVGDPGVMVNLDLRKDDQVAAVSQASPEPAGGTSNVDIWLIDLARGGIARKLTDDPAREFDPAWSWSGDRVAFNSSRTEGRFSLFMRQSDASGHDELLVETSTMIQGPTWSPDDKTLLYGEIRAGSGKSDLWMLPLVGERKPTHFRATEYSEERPAVSPEGKWVAYQSNESGRMEIYVVPFPEGRPAYPVSRDGGMFPKWGADGKQLFFLTPDFTLMCATVDTTKRFTSSLPQKLFSIGSSAYAVNKDGKRFLVLVPVASDGTTEPITIVLNWPGLIATR